MAGNQELKSYIERIESLQEEIDALQADQKELFASAKDSGFDTTAMRAVIKFRRKIRKEGRSVVEDSIAMIDHYMAAIGDMPLFAQGTPKPRLVEGGKEKVLD